MEPVESSKSRCDLFFAQWRYCAHFTFSLLQLTSLCYSIGTYWQSAARQRLPSTQIFSCFLHLTRISGGTKGNAVVLSNRHLSLVKFSRNRVALALFTRY